MEDEVRRSPRLKAINNGFKKSSCSSSGCLPCNAKPPQLPKKVVRNLASSFCKVNEELLDARLSKRNKMVDGEKKPNGDRGGSSKEEDAAKGSKKPDKKK